METDRKAEKTPDKQSDAHDTPQARPRDRDSPDFFAEIERLWAIDLEDVEMAVRFRP